MFVDQPIFSIDRSAVPALLGRSLVQSLARFAAVLIGLVLFVVALCPPSAANVIYVTTLTDKVSSTGGCSLKEAIYSSTLHDTLDGVHGIAIDYTDPDHFISTGCELGSGNDTIILPTGYPLPTFQLTSDTSWDAYNPYGFTATPIINSNITIQGYGATLQWAGTGSVRLFAVGPATITTPNGVSSGTGSLTLVNVQITGFAAAGGVGADGGGGGLGAGGAIYVQSGNLTIENSTFEGNVATGGNGGTGEYGGGGGGGLGGNGGHADEANESLGGISSGAGGGGSRGNGGNAPGGGGGGGGTVNDGATSTGANALFGPGGYLCGGDGGAISGNGNNGDNAKCAGGGGGGGGYDTSPSNLLEVVSGGNGAYGGGGGGGPDQGGNGGFGGGGASFSNANGANNGGAAGFGQGGNGGFGGGGGMGNENPLTGNGGSGHGGAFGGSGYYGGGGGGGAALGAAIFSDSATIVVENSTFYNNSVVDGQGGTDAVKADNGGAAGAIFTRDGSLTIIDSTISGNQADGSGAGVVVYSDGSATFTLEDTIIADNGANECYVAGSVSVTGVDNLITSNGSGSFSPCPGVVTSVDPQLGPLQLNSPGITPTMAISTTSSAFKAADPDTSLPTDQRGVDRPQEGVPDIGAYEACAPPRAYGEISCITLVNAPPENFEPLTMQISAAGIGTVSPPLGVNQELEGSVVALSATTTNPQYSFTGWTGSVTDPASASTTILMSQAETVTANFALCNCVINVVPDVTVTQGPIVLNPVTRHYVETVTLTNTSSLTILGPISLVLDALSSNATLSNAAGVTSAIPPIAGPYVSASVNLAPGKSVSFALQFTDPTSAAITYVPVAFAGKL